METSSYFKEGELKDKLDEINFKYFILVKWQREANGFISYAFAFSTVVTFM